MKRLESNMTVQRAEIREKDMKIYKLSNEILDQRKQITDLEVSNHGISGSLRKSAAVIEKEAKKALKLAAENQAWRKEQ
jgi:hypothetical protein